MFNKIIGSVLVVLAPVALALLTFIFFQFRLLYLTDDKGRQYHIATIIKMVAAMWLIGFIDITSYALWLGFMVYFGSDAFLAYNRYQSRTDHLVKEANASGTKFEGILTERYLLRVIPIVLVAFGSTWYGTSRATQENFEKELFDRSQKAEKTRMYTARKVTTLAERADHFIDVVHEFVKYQIRVNTIRDHHMKLIMDKLRIPADTLKAETPLDSMINGTDKK